MSPYLALTNCLLIVFAVFADNDNDNDNNNDNNNDNKNQKTTKTPKTTLCLLTTDHWPASPSV